MTQIDCVILLKKGDREGLRLCYEEYYVLLFQIVRRWNVPVADAKDLVHDVFLNIWNLRSSIENKEHIQRLLLLNLKWVVLDFFKRHASRKRVINDYASIEDDNKADLIAERYNREIEELMKLVFQEIKRLPELQRKVIQLRGDGYSGAEIAEMLGTSHENVRNAIHKARQRLGKFIADRWLLE